MQYFLKTAPLESLKAEAKGLAELKKYKSQHGLYIPEVIEISPKGLVLEKIISVAPSLNHWRRLGEGLAKMHLITKSEFGFESDNWIGAKPQVNHYTKNWGYFFFKYRLKYQVEMIQDSQFKQSLLGILRQQEAKLTQLLNTHQPKASLLHGDLWNGNVMFQEQGPCLIDPAVYYGDAETDIAMTKLFGGFSDAFYEAYFQARPVIEGAEKRFPIYQLYHYLNHLNIFGDSYIGAVERGFDYISKL